MKSLLQNWLNASIRTKVLIPFVLIFVLAFVLGTYYFIHVVTDMTESDIETQLRNFTLMFSEKLSHQEQRLLFLAQNMVKTKSLADQTLNTNQIRLLQIQELQALRAEQIRFVGVFGKDLPPEDPLYPLVEKGLRGLRVTALTRDTDLTGKALHLIGVAPVPGEDWIREVVLLETILDRSFLQGLSMRLGVEMVLFDSEGDVVVGTVGNSAEMGKTISKEEVASILSVHAGSNSALLRTMRVEGTSYKAMITPFKVNYKWAGAIAIMVPIQAFMGTRTLLITQSVIYSLLIVLAMSLLYLLIVRGITTPLKALEQASKKMMAGKPVDAVTIRSSDEVGTLARTFNEMFRTLQNRESDLRLIVQELENKTRELDSILKYMAEGVVVHSRNYEIEYMNEAAIRIFGSHVGEKCHRTFYGREAPCDPCSVREILLNKKPIYQYNTQDHQGRYYEVIAQPLRSRDGSTKVITLRRDVTERVLRDEKEKKMQQKIQEERLAAIQQVVVSIKHGINNSLTSIFGALDLLKDPGTASSSDGKQIVQYLESEANRIRDIVSKLSEISRPVTTEYVNDVSMIDLEKSAKRGNEDPLQNDDS